jgi:hypothetical protein
MSESLASFRELKGVEPATEARLHEAGVFTWEALSQVAAALGSVRGATGESLHDLSGRIAEHAAVGGGGGGGRGETAPRYGSTRVRAGSAASL